MDLEDEEANSPDKQAIQAANKKKRKRNKKKKKNASPEKADPMAEAIRNRDEIALETTPLKYKLGESL
jgi:hypothetical protein